MASYQFSADYYDFEVNFRLVRPGFAAHGYPPVFTQYTRSCLHGRSLEDNHILVHTKFNIPNLERDGGRAIYGALLVPETGGMRGRSEVWPLFRLSGAASKRPSPLSVSASTRRSERLVVRSGLCPSLVERHHLLSRLMSLSPHFCFWSTMNFCSRLSGSPSTRVFCPGHGSEVGRSRAKRPPALPNETSGTVWKTQR